MKEFLSQNKIDFTDRNIAPDESALAELEKIGYMTTPVTLIDGEVVVGFDVPKLRTLLHLQSGCSPSARLRWLAPIVFCGAALPSGRSQLGVSRKRLTL